MSDHAQPPAILDHARALAQDDGRARPAFAGGAESGESKLVVLRAGDVLDDTFTASGPGVDAESKVRGFSRTLRAIIQLFGKFVRTIQVGKSSTHPGVN